MKGSKNFDSYPDFGKLKLTFLDWPRPVLTVKTSYLASFDFRFWNTIKLSCNNFLLALQQILTFLNESVARKPPPTLDGHISGVWWDRELRLLGESCTVCLQDLFKVMLQHALIRPNLGHFTLQRSQQLLVDWWGFLHGYITCFQFYQPHYYLS